jgi:hypothetical protein
MTPPDTPLSSSSDQEAMVKAMQQQMIVRKVQPLISSIKTARVSLLLKNWLNS